MTEQEIIPGKRYKHSRHPNTVYEGAGDVNPETLDCEHRQMKVYLGYAIGTVTSPGGYNAVPGFWNHFSPIDA